MQATWVTLFTRTEGCLTQPEAKSKAALLTTVRCQWGWNDFITQTAFEVASISLRVRQRQISLKLFFISSLRCHISNISMKGAIVYFQYYSET